MNTKILNIIKNFRLNSNVKEIIENNQGNINSTYIIVLENSEKYLLQKINTTVFKEPYLVMKNIELVTKHIKKALKTTNNTNYKTLNFIKTLNNESIYTYINRDGEKEYYRVYEYIDNCISYNNFDECSSSKEIVAYNAGKSFGIFHRLLNDFPVNMLSETIPNFHNTPKRFNDLILSIENRVTDRAFEYPKEIIDLISKAKECSIIWKSLGKDIPIRVSHNDTKLNNILMDKTTNEGIAVIDLDTVMPGSILFDIGDGIRSACSNTFEDELDCSKIFLNLELTKNYLKGYLEEMAPFLKKEEVKYIALSIKVLTYELALRFLSDYINGDIYFKIKYPSHNKDRFINQYILLKDIENKLEDIDKFVYNEYNTCLKSL